MTRNGALAGMLVGAITVIVWKQFGWLGLYEIIPGFLFSALAIVVFSLLDKVPSKAMVDRFNEAEREFQTPPPASMSEPVAVN
jgi:sodium/proline symporter